MIHVDGLTKRYGNQLAVDDLHFSVASGHILAMLGPNGAGKTTTVRMIMGIIKPSEGAVRIGDVMLDEDPSEVRRRIGATFEYPGLYLKMKVVEYLRYFGRLYGIEGRTLTERIDRYLTLFELTGHLNKPMGLFSRGMQQKVALCRALIHEPPVLLLDEPTSGLDPGASYDLRMSLKTLCAEEKRAVLLCTHVLEEADQLADEIIVLNKGRVVARNTPERLKAFAGGQWEYELQCLHPVENLPEILAELPWVLRVTGLKDGTGVRFATNDPGRNPELLRFLLDRDLPILSMAPLERTLEEVYLELTRGVNL